jgi:trigger factor
VNAEVSDQMIDEEIEKTRNMNARLVSVTDRAILDGDTVLIDYSGFVGEEQFEGGTATNQELVIGSNRFIPGFEEQLIGANIGDHVHVNVTFPEVYHSDALAGKDAVFHVTVNDIKFKELPTLDDEFAKDVSEFDTLEAYKASIKSELEVSVADSSKAAQRDKVIDKVTELITVEIPEKMIDAEVDGMMKEFDQQLKSQGLSLDQYVQFTGGSFESLQEQMKPDALARVKTSLVIEKVMAQENIEVSDEDVEKELQTIAEMQKRDIEEIRKLFVRDNFEYLKSNLKSRKTVDFLVENAKLV